MPENGIRIVGTRLHSTQTTELPDLSWLTEWCDHVLCYADKILIAADQLFHQAVTELLSNYQDSVFVFLVQPWISVTHPLNALVEKALYLNASELLLQSSEVWLEERCIKIMEQELKPDTLVVGARMHTDHGVQNGNAPIEAFNSPWNTMALWNLNMLGITGFLTVSSGVYSDVPGGMEEVVTISLLQHLRPGDCRAKMVEIPGLHWACDWNDPIRLDFHRQKMASKQKRAEIQLEYLGVPRGSVIIEDIPAKQEPCNQCEFKNSKAPK